MCGVLWYLRRRFGEIKRQKSGCGEENLLLVVDFFRKRHSILRVATTLDYTFSMHGSLPFLLRPYGFGFWVDRVEMFRFHGVRKSKRFTGRLRFVTFTLDHISCHYSLKERAGFDGRISTAQT